MSKTFYGWAEIAPQEPMVAGSHGTWRLTYHVGRYGIDDGGRILIAFRFASDWGIPQGEDPPAPNYTTVTTSGASRLTWRYEPKGYIRPWQRCMIIDVSERGLSQGETVEVTLGDRTFGAVGHAVQTFCEHSFEFRVAVDCFGTGRYVELAQSPSLPVVSGPPAKLVVVAPSRVAPGQPFWLGVRIEDKWGNPAADYQGDVTIDGPAQVLRRLQTTATAAQSRHPSAPAAHEGELRAPVAATYSRRAKMWVRDRVPDLREDARLAAPLVCRLAPADRGARRLEGLTLAAPGIARLRAREGSLSLSATSNPIVCTAATRYVPLWADLHGQSEETVGTNTVEDYFRYARDVSWLDASAHQGNDFQITRELWTEIKRCVRKFNAPGRFVTLLGYEWSGNSPAGGDRNVYFLSDDAPLYRSSHAQVADQSDVADDRYPVSELFARLRLLAALTIPHVGGRPANLDFHDPAVEPLIEVCSAWGRFTWMIEEALRRGYRVGFVGGSDDHSGRPGGSRPGRHHFGVRGGLTCFYVRSLDRTGLWEAMKARRCYATTGPRIVLDVDADGHCMGEEYDAASPPRIAVQVAGTADLECIEIMRGLDIAHRFPGTDPGVEGRIRVAWGGARHRGRGRIASWDGWLEVLHGRIVQAEEYAFDSPAEGITAHTAGRVDWRSATSGDEDGVILTVDGDANTVLAFHSPLYNGDIRLGDLPFYAHLGGEDLHLRVERLPRGLGSPDASLTWIEESNVGGVVPYWVHVVQTDGAEAWSSPVYVSIHP